MTASESTSPLIEKDLRESMREGNSGGAEDRVLPMIEEVMEFETTEVDRGGYRIVKKVTVTDRLVDELLRNETVEIERRPVGAEVSATDVPKARHEGDTLIVPVMEEILVTEKRLVLVEEIRIRRVRGTHRRPQTVSLRKEEIEVQRLAAERFTTAKPT